MSFRDIPALLTEEAQAEVRAHPDFRAACELSASEGRRVYLELPAPYQWLWKDLGRSAITFSAVVLDIMGQLTAQALTTSCVGNGISSPGRVLQVIRRCQEIGQFVVEDGEGIWTRRPMRVGDEMIQRLRERAIVDVAATELIHPECVAVREALEGSVEAFKLHARNVAFITNSRRDLYSFGAVAPNDIFLEREAGMLMIFDLMCAQAPDRSRLLEAAPLSRYALARRFDISRAHINKLLAEATRQGYLECVTTDRLVFSPALSDAMARQFALVFQANLGAGRLMLAEVGAATAAEPTQQARTN